MKSKLIPGLLSSVLLVAMASVFAGDKNDVLIALDKKWGEAGVAGDTDTVGSVLAEGLISVDASGVTGKAEQLADNEPGPEGATYEPTDFQVMFLNDNTAVMTHGVGGDQPHYSMHVWSRKSGEWKVVATSSTPADAE